MQITELRIAGFKSFVDPQTMPVEPGLTGIVGPNGCGKSNLLEALRWAMGANSARAMRGGEMDDLIFSGTQSRPARETAEVTLVLDNSARTAPPEFNGADTLEIERRLRRGAGSAYRINGRTVRGKDIQLLFADASTGANSPALVRQGQISELISSKPQNRRRILEEAAGIAGLNTRRHEAELRLDAASGNLERLTEIAAEMERQLVALRRQAGRAHRYQALSDEIFGLEALLAYLQWTDAGAAAEAAQGHVVALRRTAEDLAQDAALKERQHLEISEDLPDLRAKEADIAGRLSLTRIALARLETEYKSATEAAQRLEAEASRLALDIERETEARTEAEAAHERALAERAALSQQDDAAMAASETDARLGLEQARAALEQAEACTDQAREALSDLRARRHALEETRAQATMRAETLKAEIHRLTGEMTGLEDTAIHVLRVRQARNAEAEALAALQDAERAVEMAEADLKAAALAEDKLRPVRNETLQRLQALQAEITGLERLLQAGAGEGSDAPVLARIQTSAGYEKAVAAALGEEVTASSDPSAALYWAGAGVASASLPDGAEPLRNYVKVPPELEARLAQCGLIDPSRGPQLASQLKPGQRLVSQEGHLWRWDGFTRTPGAPLSAAARLEQQARLEAARREHALVGEDAAAAADQLAKACQERTRADEHLRHVRKLVAPVQGRLKEAHLAAIEAVQDAERAGLHRETTARALERAQAELASITLPPPGHAEAEARAEAHAQTALEAANTDLQRARAHETDSRGRLSEIIRLQEQAAGRRAALDSDVAAWGKRLDAVRQRIAQLSERRADIAAGLLSARERPAALSSQIEGLSREAAELETMRGSATDALAVREADVRQAAAAARATAADAARAREELAAWTVKLETAERRLNEAVAHAQEAFRCEPGGLLDQAAACLAPEMTTDPQAGSTREQLDARRRERDQLGGVNMNAAEDAAELEGRLGTLLAERDDLTGAIQRLRQGIEALNEEGRGRLSEAFERVNEHFQALFTALFDGGQAELRLIDAEDPLKAGLEILAQPPGKKLGTLNLMSGGEQALTATALIFAVFLARPAPICVLDEVDAPLDDANVDRFCRMLNEMRRRTDTRFVVITHNPVTMSRMDRLFGVTMRERGVSRLVSVDLAAAEQLVAAE